MIKFLGVDPGIRLALEKEEQRLGRHYPVLLDKHVPYSAKEVARVKQTTLLVTLRKVK